MPTRQRPGRASGRSGGSKPADTINVTNLHPESEAQKTDLWEAAQELEIPFGATMEFYYQTVATLIRKFKYDWRLEEIQVKITPHGKYLTTYAVHLRDPNGDEHLKYDTVTISSDVCDPAFTRFIADRAFMCSMLKIAEQAPKEVLAERKPTAPTHFGIDWAAPEVDADAPEDTQRVSSLTSYNSISVEYSPHRPPQITLKTKDPNEVLAEESQICSLIENFTTTCVNREALRKFWDNNENVLMFIRDADLMVGKKIGALFGDAQRRLNAE